MDTKSKKIRHYFVSSEHSESEYLHFDYSINGFKYKFTTSPDVFSKNKIDEGSEILIKTIISRFPEMSGKILDMCCGYGAIGLILEKFINADIEMCDINSLAIKLAKINAKQNLSKITNIFESDIWRNVQSKYDHIISNPPIKVGKSVLLNFINYSKEYLNDGGDITIVIKKNLGADSTKKYLKDIFGNCEVLERSKGYYILHSKKCVN